MSLRRYLRRNAGLFAWTVSAFVALSFLLGSARGDVPSLSISVDTDTAQTGERVLITVTGTMAGFDETGAAALVPSNATVSVVVEDLSHDIVIYRTTVPFFQGRAEVRLTVGPAWDSARVRVTAADYARSLIASADFRTEMSEEQRSYEDRVWMAEHILPVVADIRQDAAAAVNLALLLLSSLAALMVLLFLVVFLRIDHRRARQVLGAGVFERFWRRAFPFANVPDDTEAWLDAERTWDKATVRRFERRRILMESNRLAHEQRRLGESIRALRAKASGALPEVGP